MKDRLLLTVAALLGLFISMLLITSMPAPSAAGDYILFFFCLIILASSFIYLFATGAYISTKESNHAH